MSKICYHIGAYPAQKQHKDSNTSHSWCTICAENDFQVMAVKAHERTETRCLVANLGVSGSKYDTMRHQGLIGRNRQTGCLEMLFP